MTATLAALAVLLAAEPAGPVVVPFELTKTRHVVVSVTANGRGPYRMVFDTGAPFVIMSNAMARETGVVPEGKRPGVGMPFGGLGQFPVKRLSVGAAEADDVPAVVMDHPTVVFMSRHAGRLDGIVGFPFFARFRLAVDYKAKALTLAPSGYKPADMIAELTAMLSGKGGRAKPAPVAPAGLWGLTVAAGGEGLGVDVTAVAGGGPAAAGGLEPGDRLLTIDGRWTDGVRDAHEAAAHCPPGKAVDVVVSRGGREVTLRVTPGLGF